MPTEIDESLVQWDETPQIDESQVTWEETPSKTWGETARQKVAAGLIGARETLPFAKDIAAEAKALASGESFAESKEGVERQQKAAREESPLAYGAGEIGAFFTPVGALAEAGTALKAGRGLAGAAEAAMASPSLASLSTGVEKYLSGKLAPKVGETAAKIAGAAGAGAGLGAIQGAGEGEGLGERLTSAGTSGLIGGALGAALPGAGALVRRTPAEEAAARIGKSIPASVASPNVITRYASDALSSLPVTKGIMASGVAKGLAGLEEAAEKLPGIARPGLTAEEAGASARKALIDWADVDSRGNVNKLYNKVESLIDPSVTTPMSNTYDAVKRIGQERLAAKLGDSAAVKLVLDAATDPKGLTYAGAQRLKREIGSKLKGIMTESSLSEEELKQLYGGLREDVREAAKNAGGAKGLAAFERANNYAQKVIERRKQIGKIIGVKGDVNDEKVFSKIASLAGEKSANAQLLKTARKAMDPESWNDVTAGVITKLGRTPEGFSPDKYITAYAELTPVGKDALFGPAGNPLRNSLEDIYTVAQRYKEVGKNRNFSNTAYGILAAVGLGDIALEGVGEGVKHEAEIGAASIPLAMLLSRPRAAQAIAAALKNKTPATLANLRNVVTMELREHLGPTPAVMSEDREERASGGKVGKRDYPAKRLTRLERAAKRAHEEIALETKPIMSQPDHLVARALEIAKDK
jgi:hypothetical protein